MDEVGPLEIGEIKAISFDFTSEAGAAAVLNTPVTTIALLEGVDASPTTVLFGAPTITGLNVVQLVRPGVAGCTYIIRAHAKDAATLEHNIACKLLVVPA